MSASPTSHTGPREARIKQLWDDAWVEHEKGGIYEPFIALAESEIANFRVSLPAGEVEALEDFSAAESTHVFHSRHLAAALSERSNFQEHLRVFRTWTYDQMVAFNLHAVKSLTLANGSVVFAALAYIQSQHSVSPGFVYVIVLGSVGYILTLLGSQAVVLLSAPALEPLQALLQSRLSNDTINLNIKAVRKRSLTMFWVSRGFFYLSGLCLCAALYFGVSTLMETRPVATLIAPSAPATNPVKPAPSKLPPPKKHP